MTNLDILILLIIFIIAMAIILGAVMFIHNLIFFRKLNKRMNKKRTEFNKLWSKYND